MIHVPILKLRLRAFTLWGMIRAFGFREPDTPNCEANDVLKNLIWFHVSLTPV
ncbi:MAG: hypothetical protein JWM11_167 [Planctomycetaceae bacterium]|nr:hypothetical protein [Planctomycetaceae bacterium]